MILNYKKIKEDAQAPTCGSEYAAGLDLHAYIENNGSIEIPEGKSIKVGTGICIEIPEGYFGGIFARSGLANKSGLRPSNCVGVIDSDYRGEIIVSLYNDSNGDQLVHNGDRVAQLVILPYLMVEPNEVNKLSDTVRGEGGFGSTGR